MTEKPTDPTMLGAGRYRVIKPFVYRGQECCPGDEIDMSDGGAGAHYDKIKKCVAPERAPSKDKRRAKLEARLAKLLAKAKEDGASEQDIREYQRRAADMPTDELEEFVASGEKSAEARGSSKSDKSS